MAPSPSFPDIASTALPAPYILRLLREDDEADAAFATALYASTRDDLRQMPADPALIQQLIAMQQRAQSAGYRQAFPQASYLVLQRADTPIGRLIIHRTDAVLRLVDIAILPTAQRQGAASAVLSCLQTLARKDQLRIELAVNKNHASARKLYQRLGFRLHGEDEVQQHLAWEAA